MHPHARVGLQRLDLATDGAVGDVELQRGVGKALVPRRRQIVCRDTVVWQAAGQRRHAAPVGVVVCDVEALTVSRIKLLLIRHEST